MNHDALVRTATDSLTKSLGKSSLDEFLTASRRSMMLVDVSSSMNETIRSGGTKIDACRATCDALRESNPVPVAAFGGIVELVDRVPHPSGARRSTAGSNSRRGWAPTTWWSSPTANPTASRPRWVRRKPSGA